MGLSLYDYVLDNLSEHVSILLTIFLFWFIDYNTNYNNIPYMVLDIFNTETITLSVICPRGIIYNIPILIYWLGTGYIQYRNMSLWFWNSLYGIGYTQYRNNNLVGNMSKEIFQLYVDNIPILIYWLDTGYIQYRNMSLWFWNSLDGIGYM